MVISPHRGIFVLGLMLDWWKAYRSIDTHPVWKLPATHFKVWFAILNKANYTEGVWYDGTNRIMVSPGTLVTSQDHLASYCNLGRQVVRSAIKNLTTLESISTKSITKRYTIITVINWASYQCYELENNQQDNLTTTKRQPSDNHNIRREEGKKKNISPAGAGELPFGGGENGKNPIKVLLTVYDETYHRLHHQHPVIVGLDAKAAETLLKNRTPEVAALMVKSFLENPPTMYAEKGLLGMRHVLSAANTLLARREVSG